MITLGWILIVCSVWLGLAGIILRTNHGATNGRDEE